MKKIVDVTDSAFIGEIIRMTRYCNAKIINLSFENKDVTFTAIPAHKYNTGKPDTKWAYYRTTLTMTLQEAIESGRLVSILVYRYRITTEGKDKKPKYDMKDVIVTAAMNVHP